MSRYIILGGGVAGITAARALVDNGSVSASDEVHVFSTEPYPYYPRPLLWKFIAGELAQEQLYSQPAEWYPEHGIQLHLDTRVTALDAEEHRLTLDDGTRVTYDRLLLATGAHPWVPPAEGRDQEGVFTLRTLDDALAIKTYAEQVPEAVVIGGGLLGLETARAIHTAGPEMRVIEIADYLLPRQLDAEGAEVLEALMEAQGLRIVTGAVVEAVLGEGRADGVRTEDGRLFDGELVLFSTGIRCRAHLAQEAGLEVNRGVVVDEQMRASAEDIFAAGDVAEFEGDIYGIIPPAIEQAKVAAANMVDPGSETYTGSVPDTTLKVAGAKVTSLGEVEGEEGDAIVRHADVEAGVYRKFVVRDGQVVGAILLNDPVRAAFARQLIDKALDVTDHVEQLTSDDFDLKTLF